METKSTNLVENNGVSIDNNTDGLRQAIDAGWASIEFNPDGTIITANDNFVSTLGYASEEELIGNHHRMFCEYNYVASNEYQQFWEKFRQWRIQAGEIKLFKKDGSQVWINASYTPIKDENGKIFKVIKIANNINEMVSVREQGEAIRAAVNADWVSIRI